MAAIFACIVPPKVIEFNVTDQKLHRAQKDEELRAELRELQLPGAGGGAAAGSEEDDPVCQPGGGCRVLLRDDSVTVAAVGSAFCVFEGSLTNAEALAEAYAPVPEDEPITAAAALSASQLICHMYGKVGVELLSFLRGSFTFVLYESKTGRVLAARDGGGLSPPLLQARTPRDSLVLSNSRELLEGAGCHDLLDFLPGDYKYGWSATPRRYTPTDHARLSRRSLDLPCGAGNHHHNGHIHHNYNHPPNCQQPSSRGGSRRNSLDHHHPEGPAGGAAAGAGGGSRSRRTSLDPQGAGADGAQGAGADGAPGAGCEAGAAVSSPQPIPHPHPHRTYIVTADDPRIVKAAPSAKAVLAGTGHTSSASSDNGGSANGSTGRDKQQHHHKQQPQHKNGGGDKGAGGRGNSARGGGGGGAHGHSNQLRRRSMDHHGGWVLGAGQAADGAAPAGGLPGPGQPQPQQQQQQQQQPKGAKQHQQGQQQHSPGAGGKAAGDTPASSGGGRRRSAPGREGRPSLDGRTPTKHHPAPAAKATTAPAPAAALATAAADPAAKQPQPAASLRVDAPVFIPPWAASAVGPSTAVAVGSSASP